MGLELLGFIFTKMRVKPSLMNTELKEEDRFLMTLFETWIQLCLKTTLLGLNSQLIPFLCLDHTGWCFYH